VRMPVAAFVLLCVDAVLPVQRTVHTDKKSEHSCSRHKGRDPTYLLALPRPVLEDNGRWIRRWRRVGDAFHLTRQRKLLPPRCDRQLSTDKQAKNIIWYPTKRPHRETQHCNASNSATSTNLHNILDLMRLVHSPVRIRQ
jgi:hypothetical protein